MLLHLLGLQTIITFTGPTVRIRQAYFNKLKKLKYLWIDPRRVVATEESCQISQFFNFAHSTNRDDLLGLTGELSGWIKSGERALSLDRSGCDAVHSDSIPAPLDSQRPEVSHQKKFNI